MLMITLYAEQKKKITAFINKKYHSENQGRIQRIKSMTCPTSRTLGIITILYSNS